MRTTDVVRRHYFAALCVSLVGASAWSPRHALAAQAPPPRPAPAQPAPRPSLPPAQRPATAAQAKPATAAAAAPAPAPSFGSQSPSYKSVTMNVPPAVPVVVSRATVPPGEASKGAAPYGTSPAYRPPAAPIAERGQAASLSRAAPSPVAGGRPTKPAAAGTAIVAATAGLAAAAAANPAPARPAKPSVSTGGFEPDTVMRVAPRISQFEERYRDVKVVREPTTSGWTWLFLAWALSNSSDNSRLEDENRAMRERMAALESQLRADPQQWRQLQALSAGAGAPIGASVAPGAGSVQPPDAETNPRPVSGTDERNGTEDAGARAPVAPLDEAGAMGPLLWSGALALLMGVGMLAFVSALIRPRFRARKSLTGALRAVAGGAGSPPVSQVRDAGQVLLRAAPRGRQARHRACGTVSFVRQAEPGRRSAAGPPDPARWGAGVER
jgi:hypothetical protein